VTKYHTTTEQLADLATKAKPKLLVVYHTVSFRPGIAAPKFLSAMNSAASVRSTPEVLQEELGSRYAGQFVIGRDLDVYERTSCAVPACGGVVWAGTHARRL
jgi:ribonuclease BN (tRNA processing enzyme)